MWKSKGETDGRSEKKKPENFSALRIRLVIIDPRIEINTVYCFMQCGIIFKKLLIRPKECHID